MNTLEFNQMEAIKGSGDVSGFIAGACSALLLGRAFGWVVFAATPAGAAVATAITVGCVVNVVAAHEGWW